MRYAHGLHPAGDERGRAAGSGRRSGVPFETLGARQSLAYLGQVGKRPLDLHHHGSPHLTLQYKVLYLCTTKLLFDQGPEDLLMPRFHAWEWVALTAFAAFALYVATEPILASDDCISVGEILILLPYYALLYFGTLPVLICVAIRRIASSRRMSLQRRRDFNVAIGFLGVLLFLEVAASLPSDYTAAANRCLDFMPSAVLVLWSTKFWLCARVPRDERL
jgi:hypothetical protein